MRPVLLCLSILCSLVSFSQVWVRVPTPDPGATRNITRGISGTSSSDIWTVGYYERIPGSAVFENLILHWNGSNWQQFTTVNRSATLNDLYDVEAVSATEVWAAGTYSNSGAATPQLLKWNGSSWSHITPPGVVSTAFITSLDAISANDVWAVGGTYTNAYAIHYNGSTWTAVTVPLVGLLADELNAVHGLASNDVWAVGNSRDAAGRFRFMARHWNGSTWTNSPMPASVSGELGELLDVRMVSSNDVWAIGVILTGGFVKLHWDGSAWTVISPANGGGGALAPISSNNIYSVGADISHWNGSTWTLVDPLSYLPYPALRNAYVAPNGDVWATGRISEGTNQFDNLVMRTATGTPSFTEGAQQSAVFPRNATNISLDHLLRTACNDVSQVLTYSIQTPPLHGTLNGFPDTAVTSGGYANPAGLSYTPEPGYTGTDQFVIKVSVGDLSSQTTINATVSSLLPVTLKHFNAQWKNNTASLVWQTASELNTVQFEVERSLDGRNFEVAGSVQATGKPAVYSYSDNTATGNVYYRLKIIDRDGKTSYSGIVALTSDEYGSILLMYPNPVRNHATLMISTNRKQQVQYVISGMEGRTVLGGSALLNEGTNTLQLNVSSLPPGVYNVQVSGLTFKKQLKLAKQ